MRYGIRKMRSEDTVGAGDLVCDHIYEETGQPADAHSVDTYLANTNWGNGHVVLAFHKEKAVGIVVGVWNNNERHYEVRNLYIDEAHRGGDLAHRLLKSLLDWATEEDADVYIATVGEPRPFYRALGFEPTHIISKASLKTLRERIGGRDGERNRPNYRGRQRPGADEPGAERAEPGAGV